MTLQNLQMKDGKLEYVMQKPFDSILSASKSLTWGHLLDQFRNQTIEFKVNLAIIQQLLHPLEAVKLDF